MKNKKWNEEKKGTLTPIRNCGDYGICLNFNFIYFLLWTLSSSKIKTGSCNKPLFLFTRSAVLTRRVWIGVRKQLWWVGLFRVRWRCSESRADLQPVSGIRGVGQFSGPWKGTDGPRVSLGECRRSCREMDGCLKWSTRDHPSIL